MGLSMSDSAPNHTLSCTRASRCYDNGNSCSMLIYQVYNMYTCYIPISAQRQAVRLYSCVFLRVDTE